LTDWCILRTSKSHTLALARSLGEDGFEVWTPIETIVVSVPRANAKREVQRPMLPRYIFAHRRHLYDLLRLAAADEKPRRGAGLLQPAHAGFSVMRWFGRIPLVSEGELAALRRIEERRKPKKRAAYSLPVGATARVTGNVLCGGMTGQVLRSTENETTLIFAGGKRLKLATSLLEIDEAYQAGKAARQAA
jgi:hypothetical protein